MGLAWYLLKTESRSEFRVARHLKNIDIETFLPLVEQVSSKMSLREAPLFPGYVFIHYDLDRGFPSFHPWQKILGLVKFGNEIPVVPNSAVEAIKTKLSFVDNEWGAWQRFRPGDLVRVVYNHFEGVGEVLDEPKTPESRVKILLDFMGGKVYAQVPWASLEVTQAYESSELRNTLKRTRRTRGGGRRIRALSKISPPANACQGKDISVSTL